MRNLLQKPLPWMVLAECAIVAALAMVAWHLVTSPPAPHMSGLTAASPAAQDDGAGSAASTGVFAKPKSPVRPLLPGLNVDANFWRLRLAELNRGENEFELLEWRIVHSAMDAAKRYVKSVVVPSITRAERAGVRAAR
jgi:hypothetical protein